MIRTRKLGIAFRGQRLDPRNHTKPHEKRLLSHEITRKNHETHLSLTDRGQFNDRNAACGYIESDPRPTVHRQSSI